MGTSASLSSATARATSSAPLATPSTNSDPRWAMGVSSLPFSSLPTSAATSTEPEPCSILPSMGSSHASWTAS